MTRNEFFRRFAKYGLLFVLAVIVALLGKKIVLEKDCTTCPGNGKCGGKTDCEKY
jgi:hypothetical protein